jgi:putative PIN family toxin of toxin-antitoxin system
VGKKQKKIVRVVLDTNVLISALLFKGELSKIVRLWQTGKIIPVVSKETFEELRTVLEYPKFSLSGAEINH